MPSEYLEQRDDAEAIGRWKDSIDAPNDEGTDASGRTTLVAEVSNTVAGFLRVGPARDSAMRGHLGLMGPYVHLDFQGRGVAQALTRRGPADGPSYLWVLRGNSRAQAFYRKLGYRIDGETKEHEVTGTAEDRMTRR